MRGWVRPGEVLLHIGLPKTGTTAVQHSLAEARAMLDAHEITYPGRSAGHWAATAAMLGLQHPSWPGPVPMEPELGGWASIVREVHRARPDRRHVLSSEGLWAADDSQIVRLIEELGAIRVVVGVRRLDRFLPSIWQQRLRIGLDRTLDDWLAHVLDPDRPADREPLDGHPGPYVAEIVERWVARAGVDRVAVVVVDGHGRSQLDLFEAILSLEPGSLRISSDVGAVNRSFTAEEAAVIVRFNAMVDRATTTYGDYRSAIEALTVALQARPEIGGTRIELPSWAVPRVREIATAQAAAIAATGAHVVGDLDDLLLPATDGSTDLGSADPGAIDLEAELAAEILDALFRAGSIGRPNQHPLARWIPPAALPVLVSGRNRVRALRAR